MMRILLISCCVLLYAITAQAAVHGTEVEYPADDTLLKGYLAFDDSIQGKRPGILVVYERWGHIPYTCKRTNMLAELGYTVLEVDMYGSGSGSVGHSA